MMKKIIPAIFLFLVFVSCTNKLYNSACWQNQKVNIDGKVNEWSDPLRFYDQETGINYNISNDRYNLYFACSISKELLQTKILRSGLEFRIDTLGKKGFGVSFKYPIGDKPVTEPKPDNPLAVEGGFDKRPDRYAIKLKLLAEATEIKLTGFKPRLGKLISLTAPDKSGISAAISFDASGCMNYEAVIPFSTFYRTELTQADTNAIFNFQIKVNPLTNSGNAPGTSGGMGGGGMWGGGGMRGGGMGGGMPGGGMPVGGMPGGGGMGGEMGGGRPGEPGGYQRNTNMSAVTKTTIKLKLAYK